MAKKKAAKKKSARKKVTATKTKAVKKKTAGSKKAAKKTKALKKKAVKKKAVKKKKVAAKKTVARERTLTSKDRNKIRRLLKTLDPDNVRLAVSLLEETASDEDVEGLFTEKVIGSLLSSGARETFTLTIGFLKGREDAWERRLEGLAARAVEETNLGWPLSALMNLPEELAERFDWSSGVLDTEGLTSLSDAAAESLSKYEFGLSLDGLTSLSDAAAESLSKYEGSLSLNGLTSLSNGLTSLSDSPRDLFLAELFSKEHKRYLDLDGLTSLSDAAAEKLVKRHQFRRPLGLWLNGLKNLSDAAAESLSKYQGSLDLLSLTRLSDSAAESLSKHRGDLRLNGLTNLSDAAAEFLSKHKGGLGLHGLTSLSDAAAESLRRKTCGTFDYLGLSGLTSLSDAAAESLRRFAGNLWLNGLTSLSDAAAESLSKHRRDLRLNGLTSLSDAAAENLSTHKGGLGLNGLTSLSDAAAESLSRHNGVCSEERGAHMAGKAMTKTQVLSSLSDAVKVGWSLYMPTFTASGKRLSKGQIEGLLSALGTLIGSELNAGNPFILPGRRTTKLMKVTTRVKAAVPAGPRSKAKPAQTIVKVEPLKGLQDLAPRPSAFLGLEGLTSLSDAAAESLSRYAVNLYLDLDELPESAAEILRQHPSFQDG